MTKIQMFVNEHKKVLCIIGLLFIIGLECCVFPVGNLSLGGGITIEIINFVTAIGAWSTVMNMFDFDSMDGCLVILFYVIAIIGAVCSLKVLKDDK